MPEMGHNPVVLNPKNLDDTAQQLAAKYELTPEELSVVRRVVALFPRPVRMYTDEASALLFEDLSFVDKFTFDLETDDLVLFSHKPDDLIDAVIEMAMYLAGFSTMLGNDEAWVIEFAIGAWKPVRNRIKHQLGIAVYDRPRHVVGLPPTPDTAPGEGVYPFRTLVSSYDMGSFYQMVALAARDDVAVYFPPETHSKVLAVYVYMRRAIQEIGQGLGLRDYRTFNARLVLGLQRLERLFQPSNLAPPGWHRLSQEGHALPPEIRGTRISPLSSRETQRPLATRTPTEEDPFAAFIDELFSDEDAGETP